jgi:hypothetical protein
VMAGWQIWSQWLGGLSCACVIFCSLAWCVFLSWAASVWGGVIRARRIAFRPIMTDHVEQQHCIKFWQKLGDSKLKTIQKI